MSNKLIKLLEFEGTEMLSAFNKASVQGKGTPQEVADFRENHFNKFIANYFPFPHRITKATIIDSYEKHSDSIDTIIINPSHPYTVDSTGKFSLVLADGVDAAIEIKPDISTKIELQRGLKQIRTVKLLRRRQEPVLRGLPTSITPNHIVEFSKTIPTFIFSNKANANPIDTGINIAKYYLDGNIPIEEQVDFVVINNTGIISNYKHQELSNAGDKGLGLYFEDWRELTLPAFVLKLNESYPAQLSISKPILSYYLQDLMPYRLDKIQL